MHTFNKYINAYLEYRPSTDISQTKHRLCRLDGDDHVALMKSHQPVVDSSLSYKFCGVPVGLVLKRR